MASSLEALSPNAVLKRGYSITRALPQRSIVNDARLVNLNDAVEITLASGRLQCRIEGKETDGKKNFEQSMQDLEKIVKELEAGDLSLEKALKRFEEGMTLSQQCSQMLDETEKRVGQLIKNSEGLFSEQPFDNEKPESDAE